MPRACVTYASAWTRPRHTAQHASAAGPANRAPANSPSARHALTATGTAKRLPRSDRRPLRQVLEVLLGIGTCGVGSPVLARRSDRRHATRVRLLATTNRLLPGLSRVMRIGRRWRLVRLVIHNESSPRSAELEHTHPARPERSEAPRGRAPWVEPEGWRVPRPVCDAYAGAASVPNLAYACRP